MEKYLLDTNTVSYITNGRSSAARTRLQSRGIGDEICISSITEAELLFGIAKRGSPPRLMNALSRMLMDVQVLPWGRAEAVVYGSLRAEQEASGKPLGMLDMLIVTHAIATNSILVTSDAAFRNVKGLMRLENWATDI